MRAFSMRSISSLEKFRLLIFFSWIPSTSGTATEVTAFSVITDYSKGIKYPLADFNITPDVAIVDLDIEEAKKTAKELAEKTGRKVIAIQTDCTDKEQVDAMVEEVVKELGGLDF